MRTTDTAQRILAERLARGDISPEDYAARRTTLGAVRPSRPRVAPVVAATAAFVVVASLVVTWSVDAGLPWMQRWHARMMSGPMMGMMRDTKPSGSAPAPSPGAPKVQVVANEFSFRPARLRVTVGQTVNVVFRNRGSLFHTLTIRELGFELRADGAKSASGALTPQRTGTYEITCAVSGHVDAGMRATLVVDAGS